MEVSSCLGNTVVPGWTPFPLKQHPLTLYAPAVTDSFPFLYITRLHGTTTASLFVAQALATARMVAGLAICSAISVYLTTTPDLIRPRPFQLPGKRMLPIANYL